jgi:hypothetical protein
MNTSNTSFDLARDCSLVGVEAGTYSWSKKDKVAAANAAAADTASEERFNTYIQRLSKDDRLPPQQIVGEARKALAFPNGSPWDGKGLFLVPNVRLEKVLDTLEDFRGKFYQAVEDLIRKLPELEDKARQDLNGAFDRLGFPTEQELREKYHFSIRQSVISSPDDVRLNHVSPAARQRIEDAVRQEQKDQAEALHKGCVEGIHAALQRVVVSLTAFGNGEIKRFEDGLITGLEGIVEALPALNLGNDPTINHAIQQARVLLGDLNQANQGRLLRAKSNEGNIARKIITVQAKSILDSLKSGAVKATI